MTDSRLRATADVGYICVDGGRHAMLRHSPAFDGCAAAFTTAVLLPDRSVRLPSPVREVLAGTPAVLA